MASRNGTATGQPEGVTLFQSDSDSDVIRTLATEKSDIYGESAHGALFLVLRLELPTESPATETTESSQIDHKERLPQVCTRDFAWGARS